MVIARAGVQNRRILAVLLLIRLAKKNRAKNPTAKSQNMGEKSPPTTTPKPVCL